LCEVTDLWAALDTIERRAASTKLLLARRVEEAGRWKRDGHRGAAEQLAAIGGTSVTAARNQLETSKRVRQLPATRDALRAGRLSGAKAEAIAAAAEVAPEAEADLLEGAEDAPLADIKERCLRARAKDRDAAHARIRKARALKEFIDAEGGWNVVVRGPVEAGAAFRAAHRPIVEELFNAARAEGRREPYEAYAFDAFIELARRATTRRPRTPRRSSRVQHPRRPSRRRPGPWGSSGSITPRYGAGASRATRSARSSDSDPSRCRSRASCWATRSSSS
jgi:hypothetical protein